MLNIRNDHIFNDLYLIIKRYYFYQEWKTHWTTYFYIIFSKIVAITKGILNFSHFTNFKPS